MPLLPSARAGGLRSACRAVALAAVLAVLLPACSPRVAVEAPKEPITINLNINLNAEVRVKLEKEAEQDIKSNPDVF